jgi:ABC-2 type transport system ATP-binding protein
MAQKVQFIVSVLHKPDFIILDEPFSGFDPVNAQLIRDEILKMRDEGCTIVLSTHNMESVEELCDNIALINRSKLVVTGSTDDIREQYGDNQLECIFYGNLNAEGTTYTIVEEQSYKGGKRALLHINEPYTTNDVIAQLIESNTIQIDAIRRVVPRMNDIFIKLVG